MNTYQLLITNQSAERPHDDDYDHHDDDHDHDDSCDEDERTVMMLTKTRLI